MAKTDKSNPGEAFSELQNAFWNSWSDTAERLQSGLKTPWHQAAEAWRAWLPQPGNDPGRDVFSQFTQQGELFLKLCQEAASNTTGSDDWLDRWLEEAEKYFDSSPATFAPPAAFAAPLNAYIDNLKHLFGTPPLGANREQQQQLQSLAAAQVSWQQANARYQALFAGLPRATARRLRDKLTPGDGLPAAQVTSLRQLYDLWTDAAEDAFAELAFSPQYRELYGEWVNATMRLRQAISALTAPQLSAAGIATQDELGQMSLELNKLRREVNDLKANAAKQSGESATRRKKAPAAKKAKSKKAKSKKAKKPKVREPKATELKLKKRKPRRRKPNAHE